MAKILDAEWNLFSDSTVPDADQVADNIYKPSQSYSSLEHINGHLDQQNVPIATSPDYWLVGPDAVQDNTFTGNGMIGVTRNVDFFRNPLFVDKIREELYGPDPLVDDDGQMNQIDNTLVADDEDFIAIPGACIEFYLPYDCNLVLFTWNVQFDDDGDNGPDPETRVATFPISSNAGTAGEMNTRTWLRFYVDNAWVEGQERITQPTKLKATGHNAFLGGTRYMPGGDPRGPRYWNGHHAATVANNTGLTKGWHSAGLRIFSNSNQARVRIRGIRYMFFR